MVRYIVKRTLAVVPVFVLVAFLSFALVSIYPGDFFTPWMIGAALNGQDPFAFHRAMQIQHGIDKSFFVQFLVWLRNVVFYGNFGVSMVGAPISRILFSPSSGLYWTLLITGCAMVVSWLFGIPLGIIAAIRHKKPADFGISLFAYLGISAPPFALSWLFFYMMFKWINPLIINGGVWGPVDYKLLRSPMSLTKLGSYAVHLIPIVLITAAPLFASIVRYMKLNMQDVLPSLYLKTARAKGLSERRVVWEHALRNALNPLISLFGIMLPALLTGSLIAARILGYPEFGRLLIDGIANQDQPVITACLLFYCSFLIVGNLIADLLLAMLDPRIRYD